MIESDETSALISDTHPVSASLYVLLNESTGNMRWLCGRPESQVVLVEGADVEMLGSEMVIDSWNELTSMCFMGCALTGLRCPLFCPRGIEVELAYWMAGSMCGHTCTTC